MEKYERHLAIVGDRNSYSKTDHDVTFMGMKEDPMRNHQLKAAYNAQVGSENQFILGWSIHQRPADTSCPVTHLRRLKKSVGQVPSTVVADAGYGSEENYEFLEKECIRAFVKYNIFHRERKRAFKKAVYRKENMPYDEEHDRYRCPAGNELTFHATNVGLSENGFCSELRIYKAKGCLRCARRKACCHGRSNRSIQINRNLDRLRNRARQLLDSPEGRTLRSQRPVDIESVWGQIKHDRHFGRFMLRGLPKVKAEWGLVALAHNMIKKQAATP